MNEKEKKSVVFLRQIYGSNLKENIEELQVAYERLAKCEKAAEILKDLNETFRKVEYSMQLTHTMIDLDNQEVCKK